MKPIKDLTGKKIGKWTVIYRTLSPNLKKTMWLCRCECGIEKTVYACHLLSGKSSSCLSCGLTDHGLSRTSTYRSWNAMRMRCLHKSHVHYKRYGGKGIKICERWNKFENFLADMGERPEGKTLDRVNTFGNYGPDNCRWATPKEQQNNMSSNRYFEYEGNIYTNSQLAEKLNIKPDILFKRIKFNYKNAKNTYKEVQNLR